MVLMRTKLTVAIGAVAMLGLPPTLGHAATTPTSAHGPTTTSPAADPRVSDLEAKVGEASAQEASALQNLAATQSRRHQLDAAVRSLDGRITDATQRYQQAEADAQRLGGAYTEQADKVVEVEQHLSTAQSSFEHAVRNLYRRGGDTATSFARVFPNTEALGVAMSSRAYLTDISNSQHQAVDHFMLVRSDAVHQRDLLDGQRQLADAAQAAAAKEQQQLSSLRAQQDRARQAATAEEANEAKIVADLQSTKDDYERQLNELTAVSGTIESEMARRQAGQKAAAMRFEHPVSGPIVSGFGYRIHPIFHTRRLHSGVDFQEGTGVPIKAAGPGVVAIAAVRGGYGNAVVIDHGKQLSTLYGHQSRIAVTVGQKVVTGQVIGYVGSTGWATGPHLHFEVRVLGVPVDPTKYF
jgi:murein DD-endopeptidase MepM/ murein hydrolase activator NlpD